MINLDFIEVNHKVRFGKACIRDTRISVADVLGWLASGITIEQIVDGLPQLKGEQILSCLAFVVN